MGNVYGLHFGINKLGFIPPEPVEVLRHAENDAVSYHNICTNLKWESSLFINSNATVPKFLDSLIHYSSICVPNDLLVISFSGHGTKILDINFDENDSYDEVLVFYDQMLIDDLVKVQFSRFKEGVNIFFITDCCHSGTISKIRPIKKAAFNRPPIRGFSSRIGQMIFDSNIEYRIIKQSINEETIKLKSSVIHFAACQDSETASDGTLLMKHGLFTHILLKTWEDGRYLGNYETFFSEIKKQMGSSQNPNVSFEGIINHNFLMSPPFKKILQ